MAGWYGGTDTYDGHDDLDYKISLCLGCDDKEGVISLIKNPPGNYCKWDLIDNLCIYDSLKCATALLEGNLDVNGDYLLHHAASYLSPKLIHLFLSHGARTDTRLKRCYGLVDKKYNGFLPLDIALEEMRSLADRPFKVSSGQSTFKLITCLCHPSMRRGLEAIKLLASSSKNLEYKAYYYAMEGKLVELAVLLIVAREKVLVPITCHNKDGAGSNQRMTILHCLKNQIESLIHEQFKLMGEFEQKKITQIHRKMMVMKSAALMLEVFERAGDTIEEYLQIQELAVMRAEVEKDVASRLEKARFYLKDGDFVYSIRDW